MKEYSKIDTVFTRDDRFNLTNELRNPVVEQIKTWIVTEKVDGTNIRVNLSSENVVSIKGRTDNSQLPVDLIEYLFGEFTADKLAGLRLDDDAVEITLFGEGYGAGIQKGGDYRKDKAFILFDVLIADKWWLNDEAVSEIALKLGIPRVPILGVMSLEDIVNLVREGFGSQCSVVAQRAEGIVARTVTPLYDHRFKRLILKLKTKDFDKKQK